MNAKTKTIPIKPQTYLKHIRSSLKRHAPAAVGLSLNISDLAEEGMKEFKSSAALELFLRERGFEVSRPWKGMPTAFRATCGRGGPVIALLAEYDALPDCGPRPGQWGHGCGHNLLGAASALAGVLAAEALQRTGGRGRIVVFGTPAEETLSGKVMMAELGAFGGLDAVIAWHPDDNTCANIAGGLAMDSLVLKFSGKTAHAGVAPHKGRSALDAAMLTDVAVNFMREHIEEDARMHCVVTEGGKAPNVVPDSAEMWYYVRGRDRRHVDELRRRLLLCAVGAATATETRCRASMDLSVTERVRNNTLAGLLDAMLRRCGPPRFTPADALAAAKVLPGRRYRDAIDPIRATQGRGSTDEDNVSWFAPLGRINVTCVPAGATPHHRTYAALARTGGAMSGMAKAAEVMAAACVELAGNPRLRAAARDEFRQAMRGRTYKLPKRA